MEDSSALNRYDKREVKTSTRSRIRPGKPQVTISNLEELVDLKELIISNYRLAHKTVLALLIAAHNEEMVIEQTIQSAIRAGMLAEHIYVVDDNSSDKTSQLAKAIVGKNNVIKVKRSGKGLALSKAIKRFRLAKRYRWVHIADADGGFAPDYFSVFRRELRVENVAATGYVKSIPGDAISQYRVFEYTIGLEIHRRLQSMIKTISVIPGPTSCFRSDILSRVDFANMSLTEDFDVTLQIHRQKLGPIQFIPKAVAYTQDPKNYRDFIKQISRWNRGILQGVKRHKIGFGSQRIDAYLSFQLFQNFLFFANYCILIPALAILTNSPAIIAKIFLFDVLLTLAMVFFVSLRSGRWDILSAFPAIYILRWASMFVFMKSFIEVIVLNKYQINKDTSTWSTAGRRYKSSASV